MTVTEIDNEVGPDGERTLYEIPQQNFEKFSKQIAKLSAKSEKLGFLPIKPIVFSHEEIKVGADVRYVYQVYLQAETPKVEGWTFAARIDHANETGNVVRSVPNLSVELPDRFRTCAPNCDHCGQNRRRRDTFVLVSEFGEFQQVGSSCLQDFFGHDPYKVAKLAELLGYADEVSRGASYLETSLIDYRWIDVEEYAALAAVVVQQHGWVSASAARENPSLVSTRERTYELLLQSRGQIEAMTGPGDRLLAQHAFEWARSLADKPQKSDYEHNISVIANASVMEPRSMGLAASIVGVFFKNQRAQSIPAKVELGSFEGVLELMKRPGSKLAYPKIRLALENGQPVILNIAGPKSKYHGSVMVTDGGPFDHNVWFGSVTPDGQWKPSNRASIETQASVAALLAQLASDPAGTATAYGRLTGNCCFCTKPLTDERSTAVGYGKTCAGKYGLPWSKKEMAA